MIPGPECAVGQPGLAADRAFAEEGGVEMRSGALDQFLDTIDDAGEWTATYHDGIAVEADQIGALLQHLVEHEAHARRCARRDGFPQAACRVRMLDFALYDHACSSLLRLTE